MNEVTLILVMLAVITIMAGIIWSLIKTIQEKKKEIADLNIKIQSARVNIEQLSAYIDKILKIKNDEKSISQKIKEAENDEEVYKIIADIVSSNNNRLQNN